MQTLLILTDFSDAALHASKYACKLAQQYNFSRIILYHNYQVIVPGTDLPVMLYDNDDSIQRQDMEQLGELRETLYPLINDSIIIEIMTDPGFLPDNINTVSKKEMADIIVMGMKGKSNVEQILIGSNTIKVVEHSHVPVLIVPIHAPVSPIRTVLFACDLKKTTETTPSDLLIRVLDIFQAKLHVLNVDEDNKHFSQDTPLEISHLNKMLNKYQPEYHFVNDKDKVGADHRFIKWRTVLVLGFKNFQSATRTLTGIDMIRMNKSLPLWQLVTQPSVLRATSDLLKGTFKVITADLSGFSPRT